MKMYWVKKMEDILENTEASEEGVLPEEFMFWMESVETA